MTKSQKIKSIIEKSGIRHHQIKRDKKGLYAYIPTDDEKCFPQYWEKFRLIGNHLQRDAIGSI